MDSKIYKDFLAHWEQHPGDSFFKALRDFSGYQALYGKRNDGAFEDLVRMPEDKFPNTL